MKAAMERNPIRLPALNRAIGYEKGAATAKQAYKEGRPIIDVAMETTGMSREELEKLLDPLALADGRLEGQVGRADSNALLEGAAVRIPELGLSTITGSDGRYAFSQVPSSSSTS